MWHDYKTLISDVLFSIGAFFGLILAVLCLMGLFVFLIMQV